ncbi:flippase [Vibrio sinaloensis]|uniref:flippase n=1 Tax=Photobacterium sp. (strain ATCC 43367) TaxID=379097 RepID=UPI000693D12E|nr:flippase [Vibrio sinaloensis]
MIDSKALYRKFIGAAGLQIVCRGLSVVSGIILARYLGPEQYGLYSFVLSIVTIAMMVVVAGLPLLLIREVANLELDKLWADLKGIIYWSSLSVLVFSVAVISVFLVMLFMESFDIATSSLLWFAIVLIPIKSYSSIQGAILNGFRKPILALIPESILMPSAALLFYGVYIHLNIKFTALLLIQTQLVTAIVACLSATVLIKKIKPTQLRSINPIFNTKKWYSALLPFTIMSLLGTLNVEVSSILLGTLGTKQDVGFFKVALQGVTLVTLGLTAINTISGPNIARLFKSGNIVETQHLLTRSVKLACMVSMPVVIFFYFWGEWVITLLFGYEYAPSSKILIVLCLGQTVNAIMGSSGLVLNMTGNESKSLRALFATLLINTFSLAILVPIYGSTGAAVSVSISMIFWNLLMAYEVYKITGLKTWLRF